MQKEARVNIVKDALVKAETHAYNMWLSYRVADSAVAMLLMELKALEKQSE